MARPADTSHDAHDVQVRALRAAGSEARLAMAVDMSDSIRAVAAAGIRARHPEYAPAEVDAALAEMFHAQGGARR